VDSVTGRDVKDIEPLRQALVRWGERIKRATERLDAEIKQARANKLNEAQVKQNKSSATIKILADLESLVAKEVGKDSEAPQTRLGGSRLPNPAPAHQVDEMDLDDGGGGRRVKEAIEAFREEEEPDRDRRMRCPRSVLALKAMDLVGSG